MEHICFEVQLCSEILIFNENSNFWYTDHPEKPALILQSVICVCSLIDVSLCLRCCALRVLPAEIRLTVYRRLLNNSGAGTIAWKGP